MIEAWMIIVACLAPNYTECVELDRIEFVDPLMCQLRRPAAAAIYQLEMPDGWLTFTKCELVNPEKNERRGEVDG